MDRDPIHHIILPRLVVVADGFVSGRTGMSAADVRARVLAAVRAGVAWVQLRDYGSFGDAFGDEALRFAEALRDAHPSVMLSLSRRPDIADGLAAGVHTGEGGPTLEEARDTVGPLQPLGYSAHTVEEADHASKNGADYIFLGPVYSTTTHPGREPLGLDMLTEACHATRPVPVYAIGGVTPERAAEVHKAGAYGAAVLSGILDADDVGEAVTAYLHALRPPSSPLDHPIRA
ncbi:MAG TPA: thiamine phosphate synthase [Rhodothermales bacterium]|nr:thiamine phosphate synthase [Rhodothermales bacterium]